MTIKIGHSRRAKYIDPVKCYTGKQPATVTGEAARATFNHLMNWKQNGAIINYSGRYDQTLNGNWASLFYVVTPVYQPNDPGQLTRKLGIECQCWDHTDTGAGATNPWNPTWNGADIFTEDRDVTGGATQSDNEPPRGEYFYAALDANNDNETAGYTWNELSVPSVAVANLSVCTLPEFDGTTEAAYRLAPGNFGIGQTLRGDLNNSVGTIAQFENSRSTFDADCISNNTKRCLMQWIHPSGYQYDGGQQQALTWTDAWNDSKGNFKFKIRGRDMRGYGSAGVANVDIAYVTRRDAGTAIRFTSASTGDTHTKTFGSTKITPFLNVDTSGFNVDLSGDEITIECYASTLEKLEIKSLSLWEKGKGDQL